MNAKERLTIELRLKDGYSAYKIAKELNRSINTILNEIRRGTTTQIKQGKHIKMYLSDTGANIYNRNRENSCRTFKRLECSEFINYAVDKIKNIHGLLTLVSVTPLPQASFNVLKWFALKLYIIILILGC